MKKKTILIFGGTSELLVEPINHLLEKNYFIILVSSNHDKLNKKLLQLQKYRQQLDSYIIDVRDFERMKELKETIKEKYESIDGFINAVGISTKDAATTKNYFYPEDLYNREIRTFMDIPLDEFNKVMSINLNSSWLICQLFSELMFKGGGSIINVSSMAADRSATRVPIYSVAKAGVENLTKWFAVHLAKVNIRVNAIVPGFIITELNKHLLINNQNLTERGEKILAKTPIGRFGTSKDFVGIIEFLLEEEKSAFITGTCIPVDGGFLSHWGV